MSGAIRRHIFVAGRVQGVFYRASAAAEAEARGLAGWVRNLRDGRVEAVVEGPAPAVEAFVAWAHRGPVAARVDAVEAHSDEPAGLTGFAVRPTA